MAMPTSGCIAIKSAPQTCGSICAAVVQGGGGASGSLSALSVSAGKSAPHCMREFYGYSPPTGSISVNNPSTTNSSGSLHINLLTASGPWTASVTNDTYDIITSFLDSGSSGGKITAGSIGVSTAPISRSATITYCIEPHGVPTATWTITIPAYQ